MTLEDYLNLLQSPTEVAAEDIADLQAMLSYAPYCASARILLLKAIHQSHDTNFSASLAKTVLFAHNSEEVYFLLYPKAIVRQLHTGDDYFTLMDRLQEMSQQTGESFESLAKKLQEARLGLLAKTSSRSQTAPAQTPPQTQPTVSRTVTEPLPKVQMTEQAVQECLARHDYFTAAQILRYLHLHNPKKSRYFADQIAFLDKVMALQGTNKPQTAENQTSSNI